MTCILSPRRTYKGRTQSRYATQYVRRGGLTIPAQPQLARTSLPCAHAKFTYTPRNHSPSNPQNPHTHTHPKYRSVNKSHPPHPHLTSIHLPTPPPIPISVHIRHAAAASPARPSGRKGPSQLSPPHLPHPFHTSRRPLPRTQPRRTQPYPRTTHPYANPRPTSPSSSPRARAVRRQRGHSTLHGAILTRPACLCPRLCSCHARRVGLFRCVAVAVAPRVFRRVGGELIWMSLAFVGSVAAGA